MPSQVLVAVAENLYRDESSQIYYAVFKRGARQFKRSLKTTDRGIAKSRLRELLDRLDRSLPGAPEQRNMLLAELLVEWFNLWKETAKPKTVLRREGNVRNILRAFPNGGAVVVRSINEATAKDWYRRRQAELGRGAVTYEERIIEWQGKKVKRRIRIGASSTRSLNMELEVLGKAIDLAVERGILLDNPFRKLKRAKAEKTEMRIPTRHEFSRVVGELRKTQDETGDGRVGGNHLPGRAADLLEFLGYSGLRLMEVVTLHWGDVDFEAGRLRVHGGDQGLKGGEWERHIILYPALKSLLERMKNHASGAKIFQVRDCRNAINKACTRLKIKPFRQHDLRHFFVSNALELGVDVKALASFVGHKDGGKLLLDRYAHLRDTHAEVQAAKLTFFVDASPPIGG